MTTVAEVLAEAAVRLRVAGIDTARLDSRVMLSHLLAITTTQLFSHPERSLSAAEAAEFEAMVARRAGREPVSHIVGWREFWSLRFRVTADTLDPRPDTETVVEAVLERLPDRQAPLWLLDLGTGTGCLLLSLLHELPNAEGVGVDISGAACRVAAENARVLGLDQRVRFVRGDWGTALDRCFDAIVSNPPYIRDSDIARLQPEVALHEPKGALSGGADGLACYRALAPHAARSLRPGGVLALEVGIGQAEAVAGIVAAAGLEPDGMRRDLAGVDRCVLARRAG